MPYWWLENHNLRDEGVLGHGRGRTQILEQDQREVTPQTSCALDSLGFTETKVLIWVFSFQHRLPVSLSAHSVPKACGDLVSIKYLYISPYQRSQLPGT